MQNQSGEKTNQITYVTFLYCLIKIIFKKENIVAITETINIQKEKRKKG